LTKVPEVLELHHVAGEDCYLVKVRTKDPQSLIRLMREKFKIPNLLSTKTTIVLETLKETNQLPIPKI
jgi:Lrp/AsnC family leucine-responsive transcriptional regulator